MDCHGAVVPDKLCLDDPLSPRLNRPIYFLIITDLRRPRVSDCLKFALVKGKLEKKKKGRIFMARNCCPKNLQSVTRGWQTEIICQVRCPFLQKRKKKEVKKKEKTEKKSLFFLVENFPRLLKPRKEQKGERKEN